MDTLILKLRKDYPGLQFETADSFYWSPKDQKVFYNNDPKDKTVANWSLLHEVGHGLLGHIAFESDFQLLKMEVEAWEEARTISTKYGIAIDPDHIQDCLDTYRDWLYQRSTCPECTNCSLQIDSRSYMCFNCGCVWQVSQSRMCRPYRRLKQKETL